MIVTLNEGSNFEIISLQVLLKQKFHVENICSFNEYLNLSSIFIELSKSAIDLIFFIRIIPYISFGIRKMTCTVIIKSILL